MFYCILTGFAALLISGKVWLSLIAMVLAWLVLTVVKGYAEDSVKKRGGIESASVLDCVSYKDKGGVVDPTYTEYTVLVRYRNGEKARYVLNGNQAFFKVLKPYIIGI